ncbi:MAG: hypothetical protein QOE88_762 [Verrucomicrobiota bacterium]|nr:hypothetical protein [Verrucomicrobiota bacterium]
MEWWSGGVVEWWSGGVVESWSRGVVEWWRRSAAYGLETDVLWRRFLSPEARDGTVEGSNPGRMVQPLVCQGRHQADRDLGEDS